MRVRGCGCRRGRNTTPLSEIDPFNLKSEFWAKKATTTSAVPPDLIIRGTPTSPLYLVSKGAGRAKVHKRVLWGV